jgi:hypothetical protein
MNRVLASSAAVAALVVAGCASEATPAVQRSNVLPLGDHYESSLGSLFVIGVQGEYRLIRCIPAGPIAGCYEDLLVVPREEVKWNRWLPVEKIPGLELAIVSPTEVAFRVEDKSGGVPK